MTIFGKLFRPDQNDASTLLGHLLAFGGFLMSRPDGQAVLASLLGTLNPTWANLVPLALLYFGGAKAAQTPTGKTFAGTPAGAIVVWWLAGLSALAMT